MRFQSYSDPGHGWVKVPHSLLAELNIAGLITPYSYMRGDYAYLEEDCDLATFILAMERAGRTVEIKGHTNGYRSSRVRGYLSYRDQSPVLVAANQ